MGTLLVVRHGRADGNTVHRLVGHSDTPLDELGRRQAERLAARLEKVGVTRIVSSDLSRALDTVRPLATRIGTEPVTDRRLREIDNGDWTGLVPAEIDERWPDLWQSYRNGVDVARPGGERWADVRTRVRAFLADLGDPEGVTVIATHGGPSLLIVEWALGVRFPGNLFAGPIQAPDNASVTTIQLPGPRLIGFNDVGHLDEAVPDTTPPYEPVGEPSPDPF